MIQSTLKVIIKTTQAWALESFLMPLFLKYYACNPFPRKCSWYPSTSSNVLFPVTVTVTLAQVLSFLAWVTDAASYVCFTVGTLLPYGFHLPEMEANVLAVSHKAPHTPVPTSILTLSPATSLFTDPTPAILASLFQTWFSLDIFALRVSSACSNLF